jgi:hypothetical protein
MPATIENPKTGNNLITELLRAVKAQASMGDRAAESTNGRRNTELLTERWQGTPLAAQVLESAGAQIHMRGCYKDESLDEYLEFNSTKGTIQTVSPANGGYIEFDSGAFISMGARAKTGADSLGLKLNVLDEAPILPFMVKAN